MVDVPAGKRLWKCPDCGREVVLSVTQLDPLACEECLAKLKGNRSPTAAAAAPLALPGLPLLLAIGGGLLVIGLIIGFVAGRMSVPPPPFVRPTRPAGETARSTEPTSPDAPVEDDGPDEATRPGANYKWVRGYTRKDGVKVKGHWSKK
ncbi:MAG: hypothetical protein JWP89_1017 [Schlesneria sp.]|nr:hypothetical protein [Schlesneria sp.]